MYIVSVFLFAAAANLDSFVVGLSYGVRRVHIQFRANLLIAGIVMLGTFLSMVLGAGLKGLIPAEWGGRLGSGMILLLGAYCLVCFFVRRGEGEAGPEVKLQYMEMCIRDRVYPPFDAIAAQFIIIPEEGAWNKG